MRSSESTLRSAVPSGNLVQSEEEVVLAGATLVELHPPRVGRADVLLRGMIIGQVGGEIPAGPPRIDASGCVITPAFTIAHTHLHRALSMGMPMPAAPPQTLHDYLQWIWWPLDRALDDELVEVSALVAAAAAAKAGAAVVIDLHSSPNAIDGSLDRVESALDEVGLRGILAYETSDRDGSAKRDAALAENRRWLKRVRSGSTFHRGLVGAHAPMSLNDETLDALCAQANEFKVGMHIQLAEDGSDGLDAERNRGAWLAQRIERLGAFRSGSVIAHANELPLEALPPLTKGGAIVATCPRANARHGARLFAGWGDGIALGTAGIDGNLLAEAQAYALRHEEARDGLMREVGLRIVTGQVFAGRLLGDGMPPRIAAGARADLAVLEYDPPTPINPTNVLEHVARGLAAAQVRHTIVGGRFVVKDRVLTTLDERALLERARPAATRLWERMQGYG